MTTESTWHTAFPQPRNQAPDQVSREALLERMMAGECVGKDFLLVDLRRNDNEGGTIQGSLNLPAQSLYYSLPTLLNLCQMASIKQVIFYCGSSRGRGTRAAGWFDDLLKDQRTSNIKSAILLGGIRGWATAGPEYTLRMQGYDETVWATHS